MYVSISIHRPRSGMESKLIDSMHRYGAAAADARGLIGVHTLRDPEQGVLVGLAMWENREAWEAGVRQMRDSVAGDPFDEWESAPVEGFSLEEV
jgi:heme-degrading monooxygenase HmoA